MDNGPLHDIAPNTLHQFREAIRRLLSATINRLHSQHKTLAPIHNQRAFDSFLEDSYKVAMASSLYTPLIRIIESNEILQNNLLVDQESGRSLDQNERPRYFGHQRFKLFLQHYISLKPDLTWDTQSFNTVYDSLIQYISSERIPVIEYAPLIGFRYHGDSIRLNDDIVIRRMHDSEKHNATNRLPAPLGPIFGPNIIEMALIDFAIIANGFIAKNGAEHNGGLKQIDDVLTTLRLIREGDVRVSRRWFKSMEPTFQSVESFRGTLSQQSWLPLYDYQLTDADISTLIPTYQRVAALPEGHFLHTSIRRLNQSYERPSDEDRLIDYWIALESIFVDGHGELSYKSSMRMARLLGDDLESRLELKKSVQKSYNMRSTVVHGNTSFKNLHRIVNDTEHWLRMAIQRLINPEYPSSIDEIEREMLR